MKAVQISLGDDAHRSLPVAWAGDDVQQEDRHQRAKEDSEKIALVVTSSGRFMHKILDQQQKEGLISLESPI